MLVVVWLLRMNVLVLYTFILNYFSQWCWLIFKEGHKQQDILHLSPMPMEISYWALVVGFNQIFSICCKKIHVHGKIFVCEVNVYKTKYCTSQENCGLFLCRLLHPENKYAKWQLLVWIPAWTHLWNLLLLHLVSSFKMPYLVLMPWTAQVMNVQYMLYIVS